MNLRISLVFGVILASGGAFAACASSDDDSGPGAGGSGAVDGSVGGTDGSSTGGKGGSSGGSGGSSATGGSGGTAGEGGSDAGSGGAPEAGGGSTITGHIVDLLTQQTGVAGVTVCIYEDETVPCVTTDANGTYSIAPVPAGAEILMKYTKTGYFPALVTVHTTPGIMDIGDFPAPTNDEANTFASLVGTTIDFTKGQLLALALTGSPGAFTGQDGVTATITPQSGSGPYYTGPTGIPDKSLGYTSTSGAALFANMDPGEADVDLTHYSKTCQRYSSSWVGTKPTSAKVKMVGGYITGGAVLVCP